MTLNCSRSILSQPMRTSIDSWSFVFQLSNRYFDLYMDELKSCIAMLQLNTQVSRGTARCAQQRATIAYSNYQLMRKVQHFIEAN